MIGHLKVVSAVALESRSELWKKAGAVLEYARQQLAWYERTSGPATPMPTMSPRAAGRVVTLLEPALTSSPQGDDGLDHLEEQVARLRAEASADARWARHPRTGMPTFSAAGAAAVLSILEG